MEPTLAENRGFPISIIVKNLLNSIYEKEEINHNNEINNLNPMGVDQSDRISCIYKC